MINVPFYQFSRTLAEVLASPCSSRQVYSDLCSQRGLAILNQGQARQEVNCYRHSSHITMFTTGLQIKAHLGAQIKVFLCLHSIISKCLPKILH